MKPPRITNRTTPPTGAGIGMPATGHAYPPAGIEVQEQTQHTDPASLLSTNPKKHFLAFPRQTASHLTKLTKTMSNELKSYTPAELAEELKVPKRTVLRAIIRKELKAIRYSPAVIRVLVTDAQEWINTLRK